MLLRRFPLRATLLGLAMLIVFTSLAQALRQGLFEAYNDYVLMAPHANGVRPGVGVEYAGFEIGRVQDVSLSTDGQVEISIRVARKYEELVRADSQFALEQPMVGLPKIVIETTAKRESLLPSGSVRTLRITKQVEQLMKVGMEVAEQIRALLNADSALSKTLDNVQALTASMKDRGLLRSTLGDDTATESVLATLRQSSTMASEFQKTLTDIQSMTQYINTTAKTTTQTMRVMDSMVTTAHEKILGAGGTLAHTNEALTETTKTLRDVQGNLQELQKTLKNMSRVMYDASATATATTKTLRNVDTTVTQVRKKILGTGGIFAHTNSVLTEMVKTLQAVQSNLHELQKTLGNATRASGEAANAAQGLDELRAYIDSVLRNVDSMLRDLKRFGVFSKDGKIHLP